MATISEAQLIRSCKCANAYQDSTYGKGMRVFTPGNKGVKCTVCNALDSSVSAGTSAKTGGKGK